MATSLYDEYRQHADSTRAAAGDYPGLITHGNIDLYNRPHVRNADGSISTVRSMSFDEDGKEVLVPTVSDDGRILSNADAIAAYKRTGRHLGKFSTVSAADGYAEALHEQQARMLAGDTTAVAPSGTPAPSDTSLLAEYHAAQGDSLLAEYHAAQPGLLERVGQSLKALVPTQEDQAKYGTAPFLGAETGPLLRLGKGIAQQTWQDINTLARATAPSSGTGGDTAVAPRPALTQSSTGGPLYQRYLAERAPLMDTLAQLAGRPKIATTPDETSPDGAMKAGEYHNGGFIHPDPTLLITPAALRRMDQVGDALHSGYTPPSGQTVGDHVLIHEYGHYLDDATQPGTDVPDAKTGPFADSIQAVRNDDLDGEAFAERFNAAIQFLRSGQTDTSSLDAETQRIARALLTQPVFARQPLAPSPAPQGGPLYQRYLAERRAQGGPLYQQYLASKAPQPSLIERVGAAAKTMLMPTAADIENPANAVTPLGPFAGPASRLLKGIATQTWQDINTLARATAPSSGTGGYTAMTPEQNAAWQAQKPAPGEVGGAALRTGLMFGGAGLLGKGAGALAETVLPEAIAAPVARVATGTAVGAAFNPSDPAVGAIVGGGLGAAPETGKLASATQPLRSRVAEMIDPSISERIRTAETNPVSGLANRAAYDRALPTAEADPNTAVVRFDVNGLKGVNDALGHDQGDAMLSNAGAALRVAAKSAGVPARLFHPSGDEFAALVPTHQAQAFRDAAEQAYGVQEHAPGVRSSLSGGIGPTDATADAASYARKATQKSEQGIASRASMPVSSAPAPETAAAHPVIDAEQAPPPRDANGAPPEPPVESAPPSLAFGDVLGMSPDELQAHASARTAWEQNAEQDIFGEQGAKAYAKAQRTLNSSLADPNSERYQNAQSLVDRLEGSLTPDQERRLFGVGETGYNAGELRRIADAASHYSPGNLSDADDGFLVATIGRELLTGKATTDAANAIALRGAVGEAMRRGATNASLMDAVRTYAQGRGISAGDAGELLNSTLDKINASRPTPPTPPAAQKALPAAAARNPVDIASQNPEYRFGGVPVTPEQTRTLGDVVQAAFVSPFGRVKRNFPDVAEAATQANGARGYNEWMATQGVRYALDGLTPEQRTQFMSRVLTDNVETVNPGSPALPALRAQYPQGVEQEPWFQQALQGWKKYIEQPMEQYATQSGVGQMRRPSLGAYMKMVATDPETGEPLGGAGGSVPKNLSPRKQRSLSAIQATGKAAGYSIDPQVQVRSQAEKMVKGAQNKFLAEVKKVGQPIGPKSLPPEGARVVSVESARPVETADGETVPVFQRQRYAVHPDVAKAVAHMQKTQASEAATTAFGESKYGRKLTGLSIGLSIAEAPYHAFTESSIVGRVPGAGVVDELPALVPVLGPRAQGLARVLGTDLSTDANRATEQRLARAGALRPHVAADFSNLPGPLRAAMKAHQELPELVFGENGFDKKARVWLANRYLEEHPAATDEELRKFVTDKAGNYVAANSGELINALQKIGLTSYARFASAAIRNAVKTNIGISGLGNTPLNVAKQLGRATIGYELGKHLYNYAFSGHGPEQNNAGHENDIDVTPLADAARAAVGAAPGKKPVYLRGGFLDPQQTRGERALGINALLNGGSLSDATREITNTDILSPIGPAPRAAFTLLSGYEPYLGRDGLFPAGAPGRTEGETWRNRATAAFGGLAGSLQGALGSGNPNAEPFGPVSRLTNALMPQPFVEGSGLSPAQAALRDRRTQMQDYRKAHRQQVRQEQSH